MRMNEARERWLNAKKAFEEFRDGFQQGIDDEEDMVTFMEAMDHAEDVYNMYRLEYDSILSDEYHFDKHLGLVEPSPEKLGMEELYALAAEAKQRYDDLAHNRIPFIGSWQDKKSELERLKYFYEKTLADYDLEKAQHLYFEKCDEHKEKILHPVAPPKKRQPTGTTAEATERSCERAASPERD